MRDELETIVAPATAIGRGALAIIRVDGPRAVELVSGLTGEIELKPRHATLALLRAAGETIDEAIVIAYEAPHSYTGNDLVELSVHGSSWIVGRVIEELSRRGARPAEPGEFTERAVLNGRIDLVQAEAVAELIDSRTALQARLSLRHLGGELSRAGEEIRTALLDVISRLEAALDFSDEGYQFIGRDEAISVIQEAIGRLGELEGTFRRGRATVSGLTAVILGKPNAGKSTLMNFLCGSERAIVTPIPGTTRDLLRETVEIGGLPVTLVDTAGLRSGGETVEEIGIARAREAAHEADLLLYLIDAAPGRDEEDEKELGSLPGAMVVYTKSDLAPGPEGSMTISVRSGAGMSEMLAVLDRRVREEFAVPEASPVVVNERQRDAIRRGREALERAMAALRKGLEEELVLVDLYGASNALGTLTGAISHQDIVEQIFSKFCIGK